LKIIGIEYLRGVKMSTLDNLRTNKILFIQCSCKSEVLVIEYDYEINMADFAIFENKSSYKYKLSLWQRIRYCYQILVHKKPYADQIMLDKNQLKDLQKFLNGLSL
jgi:hypothetical protein